MAGLLEGMNPLDIETVKFKAQRYVMERHGCGYRHAQAYIAGSMDILKAIGAL